MQQLITIFQAEQEARKIERTLFNTWEKIYIYRIKRDPNFPNYPSSLHQKYYNLVLAATRKAIETIHREGIEYVGNKLKTDIYFSSTDIEVIKSQSELATDLFFNAVRIGAEKTQQENALKGASTIEEHLTGVLAVFKRIVATAITMAFAKSILSKSNQLPPGLSNTKTSTFSHKVRWITAMDEMVCPVCFRLHGKIFYTMDATVPIPGSIGSLGSHPFCRCYLELVS